MSSSINLIAFSLLLFHKLWNYSRFNTHIKKKPTKGEASFLKVLIENCYNLPVYEHFTSINANQRIQREKRKQEIGLQFWTIKSKSSPLVCAYVCTNIMHLTEKWCKKISEDLTDVLNISRTRWEWPQSPCLLACQDPTPPTPKHMQSATAWIQLSNHEKDCHHSPVLVSIQWEDRLW